MENPEETEQKPCCQVLSLIYCLVDLSIIFQMSNDDLKETSRQWMKVNFFTDIFRVLKHFFFQYFIH